MYIHYYWLSLLWILRNFDGESRQNLLNVCVVLLLCVDFNVFSTHSRIPLNWKWEEEEQDEEEEGFLLLIVLCCSFFLCKDYTMYRHVYKTTIVKLSCYEKIIGDCGEIMGIFIVMGEMGNKYSNNIVI